MSRLTLMFSCFAVLTTAVWLSGCDTASKTQSSKSGHGHSGHDDQASGDADQDKIEKALAKLSPADRAAAERQKTCPVIDELLGSMGTPIKLNAQGREVFICCEGCEEDLRNDPEKVFAKLKQ